MISHEKATRLNSQLTNKGSKLVFPPQNFVDLCWKEKPQRSKDPIFIQSIEFTGREASAKIAELRKWIRSQPPTVIPYSKSPPTPAHAHVGTLITTLSSIGELYTCIGITRVCLTRNYSLFAQFTRIRYPIQPPILLIPIRFPREGHSVCRSCEAHR